MKLFVILSLSFFHFSLQAQIKPNDGDILHYRLIGFSFPEQENATRYILEVQEYILKEDGRIESKQVLVKEDTVNRIIATVPGFGRKYMWRVKYVKNKRVIATTRFYYFSVRPNPFSDTGMARVRIIDSAEKYKDMLLFFDNTRSLHDMTGAPVWFLPYIEGVTDKSVTSIRDLKITTDGTITFLTDDNIYEIDYDGKVLWSGPDNGKVSGDTTEYYHHQFSKLPDGHYMVAGGKFVMRKIPATIGADVYKGRSAEIRDGVRYTNINFGTLIEYDSAGNVVWSWNSNDYFSDADIFTPVDDGQIRPSSHLNGFYFDKDNHVFYSSYRDLSRIIKSEYPSGKTIAHYGQDFTHDNRIKGDGLFYTQHSCGINTNGNLYLFNNNHVIRAVRIDSGVSRVSSVVILKEPQNNIGEPEKIWEFTCDIDTFAKAFSPGGGGIYELNDGDLLVCMGAANRNFIVSKDKHILWNVVVDIKSYEGNWLPASGYRISPVRKNNIEQLLYR